ncbi:hypothetical protein [Xanthobacter sp. KR7-225]|uniref:hypothetical protein n=1 Tax=Xanthobacter sp. KR7-225 TaxID=3156613 RepID=UPI0032B599D8
MLSYSNATAPARAAPVVLSPRVEGCGRLLVTGLVGGVMFLLATAAPEPASAQSDPLAQRQGACANPPAAATPATAPPQGPNSGTMPGSEGSTGWTGGTGGNHTGLSPHAASPGSPQRQPEVVTGVNPKPTAQRPC